MYIKNFFCFDTFFVHLACQFENDKVRKLVNLKLKSPIKKTKITSIKTTTTFVLATFLFIFFQENSAKTT